MKHAGNWGKEHSRQGVQTMQRLWGGILFSVFEEQQGSQLGLNGMSKGEWWELMSGRQVMGSHRALWTRL